MHLLNQALVCDSFSHNTFASLKSVTINIFISVITALQYQKTEHQGMAAITAVMTVGSSPKACTWIPSYWHKCMLFFQ